MSDIARALGKQPGSIHGVVAANGGIVPAERCRSCRTLSLREREEVSRNLAAGQSMRQIATALQRAPSTISREVARHGGRTRYRASDADEVAWRRARRPKRCRLAVHGALAATRRPETQPGVVARADCWLAEAPVSGAAGAAHLPRDHLSQPLHPGPRRAQEGTRPASAHAADDATRETSDDERPGPRPYHRRGFHQRASSRGRGPRGARPLGRRPDQRVKQQPHRTRLLSGSPRFTMLVKLDGERYSDGRSSAEEAHHEAASRAPQVIDVGSRYRDGAHTRNSASPLT